MQLFLGLIVFDDLCVDLIATKAFPVFQQENCCSVWISYMITSVPSMEAEQCRLKHNGKQPLAQNLIFAPLLFYAGL